MWGQPYPARGGRSPARERHRGGYQWTRRGFESPVLGFEEEPAAQLVAVP
jgi:hypothetical protein